MALIGKLWDLWDSAPSWIKSVVRRIWLATPFASPGQPWFRYFDVEKADTVVDVGAHIGEFTVPAARKAGGKGNIIAIEPDPKNLHKLYENAASFGNVEVIEGAVMSYEGRGKLHLNPVNPGGHSLIKSIVGVGEKVSSSESIEVDVYTLDGLANRLGVNRIDFLKMDIEGCELEALKGARNILERTEKAVIEAYHALDGQPTAPKVREILEASGFNTHTSSENWVYAVRREQKWIRRSH